MDSTADSAQKSGETLSRIRIEQITGSLENPTEGTCTKKCCSGVHVDVCGIHFLLMSYMYMYMYMYMALWNTLTTLTVYMYMCMYKMYICT